MWDIIWITHNVFLSFSLIKPQRGKSELRSGKRRKPFGSWYESHLHADTNCQTIQDSN